MKIKITKRQMKKMIIDHYKKLDCFDLSVKVNTEKRTTDFLEKNYDNDCCDICCVDKYCAENTIMVFGKMYNNDVVHNFSEELSFEGLEAIVRENFDCEEYTVSRVSFDDVERISLFARTCDATVFHCRGLIVTMNEIKKKMGKSIVKK